MKNPLLFSKLVSRTGGGGAKQPSARSAQFYQNSRRFRRRHFAVNIFPGKQAVELVWVAPRADLHSLQKRKTPCCCRYSNTVPSPRPAAQSPAVKHVIFLTELCETVIQRRSYIWRMIRRKSE
jgi:hypothetical protein